MFIALITLSGIDENIDAMFPLSFIDIYTPLDLRYIIEKFLQTHATVGVYTIGRNS